MVRYNEEELRKKKEEYEEEIKKSEERLYSSHGRNNSSVPKENYSSVAEFNDALLKVVINALNSDSIGGRSKTKTASESLLEITCRCFESAYDMDKKKVKANIRNEMFDQYQHIPYADPDELKTNLLNRYGRIVKRAAKDKEKIANSLDIIKMKDKLSEFENINGSDDAYIYSLKAVRKVDNATFYYSGKVTGKNPLGRLRTHKKQGGQFSMPMPSPITEEDILLPSSSVNRSQVDISILSIFPVNQKEAENNKHFKKRLQYIEWVNMLRLAFKFDTYRVLGGK